MNKEQIINIIRDYFCEKRDIVSIYLFGSVAKDKATGKSDVDIAVLFNSELDMMERFDRKLVFAGDLEDLLARHVDVVDLRSADAYFVHQIMLHKLLILDKDSRQRVMFEVEKRREYFDRKPFYDLYHQQALQRLEKRYQNG